MSVDRATVSSDRVFRFDVDSDSVWSAISRVDDYPHWWPWLRHCDARGLVEGDRWDCTVRPPLPYSMSFTVTVAHVEEKHRVDAVVEGDIEGTATLTLQALDAGCEVRLVSALRPCAGPLVVVARAVPSVARYGHDWVLDTGYRRFIGLAL